MLYKLAAHKHRINPKREQELAEDRATKHFLAGLIVPKVGANVIGYVEGDKVKHPIVGGIFGPEGVNGARAKDTGISTFGTTVGTDAKYTGLLGAGVGALSGAAVGGLRGGLPGVLGGGLVGGLAGGATAAAGGAIKSSLNYGAGYLFGKKQKPNRVRS